MHSSRKYRTPIRFSCMTSDDVPTVVFAGAYEEAMFLKTLIESAGIQTRFEDRMPTRGEIHSPSKVYVRQADAEHARELVDDFLANGHRTKG
jgi:hypothetical protein